MSTRKTKQGYWIVDFRDEFGRKRSRSFGKSNIGKKKANDFDIEISYRKSKGAPLPISRADGIFIDELCQLWIDEKKAQGRKKGWLKVWAEIFNEYFAPTLTKVPCHLISQADVMSVISMYYSDSSQSTRNRYIGYIKSIFQFGVEHGHMQENPLAKWKKGKETARKSMLTFSDLQKTKEHAPEHLAWALEVAWNIPARPGATDLFSLRYDTHVKPDRNGIEVYHGKVNKWAFIDCSPEFMRALYQNQLKSKSGFLIEYRGKKVGDIGKALATAAAKAKLAYSVCMYDIRHLWVTTMLNEGVEPSTIAYLAGTSVRMILQNYYEPHSADRTRAVNSLPTLSPMVDLLEVGKVVNIADRRTQMP